LECLNIFFLPFQAKLLWVPGFLRTEPKKTSGFQETRIPKKGFRVPKNDNPKRIPKNGEPWLNSCFQRFGVGFPVLGNPFWVVVLRNPKLFLGSIVRNPETYSNLAWNGRKNIFKHLNMLKNAQKRNFKCVPGSWERNAHRVPGFWELNQKLTSLLGIEDFSGHNFSNFQPGIWSISMKHYTLYVSHSNMMNL
jgi:hypothetical protein